MTWYDDLMKDAEECRQKARDAKTPATSKRWYEAAEAAARAAVATIPTWTQPYTVTWGAGNSYQCAICKSWVPYGTTHFCTTYRTSSDA